MGRKKKIPTDAPNDPGEKRAPLRHNKSGEEVLDPIPLQPPLGYKRTPTLSEQIAQQVRQMKYEDLMDLEETDEEADDFEIGEDHEPLSKWENDHIPSIKVMKQKVAWLNNEIEQANRRAAIAAHETALKKPASIRNPRPEELSQDRSPEPALTPPPGGPART